jgi:hypothetical protein
MDLANILDPLTKYLNKLKQDEFLSPTFIILTMILIHYHVPVALLTVTLPFRLRAQFWKHGISPSGIDQHISMCVFKCAWGKQ